MKSHVHHLKKKMKEKMVKASKSKQFMIFYEQNSWNSKPNITQTHAISLKLNETDFQMSHTTCCLSFRFVIRLPTCGYKK